MSTTWPTSLDDFNRPSSGEPTNSAHAKHSELHDFELSSLAALKEAIGVLGSANPESIFARLAAAEALLAQCSLLIGRTGGQKLIGGTSATDNLTMQGTSATGTTGTQKAARVLVGDDGAIEAVTILNNGNVGIGKSAPTYAIEVGSGSPNLAITSGGSLSIGYTPDAIELTTGTYGITKLGTTVVPTDLSGNTHAISSRLSANPGANSSCIFRSNYAYIETPTACSYNFTGSIRGMQFEARHKGNGSCAAVVGIFGNALNESGNTATLNITLQAQAYNNAGGTVTSNYGVNALARNVSTGTISYNYGLFTSARNLGGGTNDYNYGSFISLQNGSSPGTINHAIGVNVQLINGSGTITEAIGLSIGKTDAWTNTGTITNCYGLCIGSSTNMGTNKWSIYNESSAPSYFAGSIGAGTTGPSAKLHAISTSEQLRLGYGAANYAGFTVDSGGKLKISQALTWVPPASITPASIGDLTVQATSNTSLTFKLKGSDGTVRSGSITLS